MSTLGVSIVALVVFVVGAVLLFNLWQARGNRGTDRKDRDRSARAFDAPAAAEGRAAAVRESQKTPGPASGRHPVDQNEWTRQRREPTLVPEDEPLPATVQARGAAVSGAGRGPAHGADEDEDGWYAPGDEAAQARVRHPVGQPVGQAVRADESRLPLPDEDLGPSQFEDPRLDPVALETLNADPPAPGRPQAPPPQVTPHLASHPSLPGSADRDDAASDDPAADAKPRAPAPPPYVPAAVDHVVTLVPRAPVNAERLIALTSSLRHVGSKAIRIEVEAGQGRWVPLHSGIMVACLRCSVLLANRQGPLNAVELSDFSAAMESLARQVGAGFAAPDMNQVLRQARELDAVAARLDTQVDLGVEASAPITPQRLASVARQLNLADKGGRFAGYSDGGDLLYTLAPGETADLVAFVLDVPRTAEEHDPWRSMVACASNCAQRIGGRVVDSAGRGMSVAMIENVGLQIQKRYRELADAGLKAGSPAALRVFN